VELATSRWAHQPSGLSVADISYVFTINRVAEMLGEDEDWLHELSIGMFSEDGCLTIYGTGEETTTAFTEYGIECLLRTA
jgi:hypothetical protein